MTNAPNQPIPPIVPGLAGDRTADDRDPLTDEETPVDPDMDANQVDSAETDRRAATEGTKDGDAPQ